jgi:hypothetical protein
MLVLWRKARLCESALAAGVTKLLTLGGMADGNELLWTIEVRRLGLIFAP